MKDYLTNLPQDLEEYGLCKTLLVRREIIHIKHIFTEVFVRKSVDIESILSIIKWSLMDYMEFMTQRIRNVHLFTRLYRSELDGIVKHNRDRFFPSIELYKGLNVLIVLDFDGVVTENSFRRLYDLCLDRCTTVICTANPTVTNEWFTKRDYRLPKEIHACKGKMKKLNCLITLSKKYDYVFYVDNESTYLDVAWVLGIQTYIYENKQIKYYTRKTK